MSKAQSTIDRAHLDEFQNARKSAGEAYENFLKAQQHLKSAAKAAGLSLKDQAYEHLEESSDYVKQKKDDLVRESEEYIRSNPVSSAGLAFLGGFLISRLIAR